MCMYVCDSLVKGTTYRKRALLSQHWSSQAAIHSPAGSCNPYACLQALLRSATR